jgi:hypothetical protein
MYISRMLYMHIDIEIIENMVIGYGPFSFLFLTL